MKNMKCTHPNYETCKDKNSEKCIGCIWYGEPITFTDENNHLLIL